MPLDGNSFSPASGQYYQNMSDTYITGVPSRLSLNYNESNDADYGSDERIGNDTHNERKDNDVSVEPYFFSSQTAGMGSDCGELRRKLTIMKDQRQVRITLLLM